MKVKVLAKEKGFHDGVLRRKGDEFTIKSTKELGKWMKIIRAPKTKETAVN